MTCSAKSFNYDRVVHRKVHLRVGTDERQYNAPAFASGGRTGDAATRLAAHGFCAARILSHGFLRFQHHFRRPSRRQTKLCTARAHKHQSATIIVLLFRRLLFSASPLGGHTPTHTRTPMRSYTRIDRSSPRRLRNCFYVTDENLFFESDTVISIIDCYFCLNRFLNSSLWSALNYYSAIRKKKNVENLHYALDDARSRLLNKTV